MMLWPTGPFQFRNCDERPDAQGTPGSRFRAATAGSRGPPATQVNAEGSSPAR
jgi:hypothetical protein